MKQQSLFNFVKKIDQNEIEKKKIELNKQTTILSTKSVALIRKRNKIHLLDGLNYSPENCIISNERKSSILSNSSLNYSEEIIEQSTMTSTPIKRRRRENKENIDIINTKSIKDNLEVNDCFDKDEKDKITIQNKSFYRVKVESINFREQYKELVINKDEHGGFCVQLYGNWMDTDVIAGDICHVINPLITEDKWMVTNTQGLIVVNPDTLLSGTTITGSLFCPRKTILQNYFNNIEGKPNKAMLLGTFIHSIFQECVVKEFVNTDIVRNVTSKLLVNKRYLLQFYEAEFLEKELLKDLEVYFPHIVKWIQQNIKNNWKGGNSSGSKKVIDIEESIWSAKYGVKGKIDVTLQINDKNKTLLPLELKTGKSSYSSEHMGQVILYTLLMGEKNGSDINEGLLLYLKDGKENIIKSNGASAMGLLKTRNELSKNLLRFLNSDLRDEDILPPVLNSERFCRNCDYLSLCTLFSRLSTKTLNQGHFMNDLIKTSTSHLSEKDTQFFLHWTKLILLEYLSLHRAEDVVRNIVTNQSRNTIRRAVLDSSVCDGSNFILTFRFPVDNNHRFSDGDPIIISKDDGSKLALVIGFVTCSVSIGKISLSSEKLFSCPANTLVRMDPYHYLKIPMTNLSLMANLMNSSDISKHLRKLIINGEPPSFDTKLSIEMINKIKPILKKLNSDQRKAILTALLAKDYCLIKGYPGSGKTSCIVSMIKVFAMAGAKILVASYTHSAVTNILMKLNQKDTSFAYVNKDRRVCPELLPRTLDRLLESNNVHSSSDVDKLLDDISIFGVTCLSLNHPCLSKIKFDLVVIDEAGQITCPISIMPLMKLKVGHSRFVLVGDVHQLPPLVTNSTARAEGLDKSLFAILCEFNHPRSISELKIQYRMNKEILKLSNQITYNNCMTCASDSVANATVQWLSNITQHVTEGMSSWMKKCVSADIADSVIFLNHNSEVTDRMYSNELEATIVVDIIEMLVRVGVPRSSVGVICPYNEQVDLVRSLCGGDGVEISTVDQYQGRDKSVIVLSLVRCGGGVCDERDVDILRDRRRVNVALTRARHKLVMVGSAQYLGTTYDTIGRLISLLGHDQIIDV